MLNNHLITKNNSTIPIEIILVIKDYLPRISINIKLFEQRNITFFAVDQWIFERDVERSFLGEALASTLIFPYRSLFGQDFLRQQEILLKKRLILEQLENIVQTYPELSSHIKIKPEYFMYEALLNRVRIFPPLYNSLSGILTKTIHTKEIDLLLKGYHIALIELKQEHQICYSKNYVSLKKKFVEKSKKPKMYIKNLRKKTPRRFFAPFFGIYSQILNLFSQKTSILTNLNKFNGSKKVKITKNLVNPQEYILIPTIKGVSSLADGVDMLTFAKNHLLDEKIIDIKFEKVGGVLNDVYLIRAISKDKEKKIIVKRFKEWSGFKWFPLSIWSFGTRNLSVLGRSRLAMEYAINGVLRDKGFNVPKIIHVSHTKRLIFMEYVVGEDLSIIIKNFTESKFGDNANQCLLTIQKVGKIFAKVHSIDITLGDTKPENVLIDSKGDIFLLDFEQSAYGGDKTWDLAVFLYFIGHYIPLSCNKTIIASIVNSFLVGYISGGGDINHIQKVGNAKYSRIFSVFILPSVLLEIANTCKKFY
ncbi:MAG TPA: hypothetical protein VMZ91_00295 [Candidatus Paceibacterota bacterium]|nr:hypothetical protein [Candidatus Paceibacterota bacterium]